MLKELFEQFIGAGAEWCCATHSGGYTYTSPTVAMTVYINKPRLYKDTKLRELIHYNSVKITKIELYGR